MPASKFAHATLSCDQTGPVIHVWVSGLLALLALIIWAAPVRADETYICEDGRAVTVKFGEIEKLSRTDPCIAKYVSRRAPLLSTQLPSAATREPPAVVAELPLPARKPEIVNASAKSDNNTRYGATEIIVHHEAPPVDYSVSQPRVEPVVFRHVSHHFHSNEALPKGPADYRRVPIINAGPGEPKIFYHTR